MNPEPDLADLEDLAGRLYGLVIGFGTFRQRTELAKRQRDILHALHIDAPPRIYQLEAAVEQSEP